MHYTVTNCENKGEETMKKLLAIILTVLMVVPFTLISAAAATVPAEPTVTSTKKYYVAFDYDETKEVLVSGSPALITNDGLTGATAVTTNTAKGNVWGNGTDVNPADGAIYKVVKAGGTIVAVGKCHIGAVGVVPATDTPILFTAKDGTKDYTSVDASGNAVYRADAPGASGNYANKGQYGMFMVAQPNSITFMGDVIFEDIVILERAAITAEVGGKIIVGSTGKMVIGENVAYYEMNPNGKNQTTFEVSEGGYLYLHSANAFKYTGKGTIVLDKALVDAGKATEAMFEGFEGSIVYQDGSKAFAADSGNQGGNEGGNENQGGNADTADMTWTVAFAATIALMTCGIAVVAKKKEN